MDYYKPLCCDKIALGSENVEEINQLTEEVLRELQRKREDYGFILIALIKFYEDKEAWDGILLCA